MSCMAMPSRPTTRSNSPAWSHRVDVETLSNIEVVNNARRPLLAYAALVLEHVIRIGKPRQVVFPHSACARDCSTRCSNKKTRRRTR